MPTRGASYVLRRPLFFFDALNWMFKGTPEDEEPTKALRPSTQRARWKGLRMSEKQKKF